MTSSNPGPRHEERRRTLETLAILGGCREPLLPFFPDGRRPDVLRFDRARRHLFVGDAKDTETPGCRETHIRLSGYAAWLRANALVAGTGTLALCHPPGSALRWRELLETIARAHGFDGVTGEQRLLDADAVVSWVDLPLASDERAQAASQVPYSAAPTWATTA